MIRPDMVVMSLFHESNSSGSVKIIETCNGPGGIEVIGQSISDIPASSIGQQDGTHDMSSVSGRVRNLASLQDGQLGLDPLGLFGIGRDDVQRADTFVVQSGVLGKRL